MSTGLRFLCQNCGKSVETWDDGNPYYIDAHGKKHYVYHPDHARLGRCIGNDVPYLCLTCGEDFKIDSRAPTDLCPKCGSTEISDVCKLDGQTCPYCREGAFGIDPDFRITS